MLYTDLAFGVRRSFDNYMNTYTYVHMYIFNGSWGITGFILRTPLSRCVLTDKTQTYAFSNERPVWTKYNVCT